MVTAIAEKSLQDFDHLEFLTEELDKLSDHSLTALEAFAKKVAN